ncbi:COX15/CtaA family protein [Solwaraspora sp. WMMD1047]|uniref:COX15/CtaA family protein n=1 Tax=Solwaraspora sp. WMMD1047 TaxID=3016102 RepID=UPI002415C7BB|nr:COX15/CtaA family protein [Solwaraspora sp. WMMD1047]MDG4831914.1 COX15/CtaA family protein [Solwaraspora sp. WMMD1047]
MTAVSRFGRFSSETVLRRVALASVVANVLIVGTGGAVRLTGSGLGCPTWPRCTEESYRNTPEMGIYGAIEFGNRLLTFAVGAIALAGLVAALLQRPRRRPLVLLAGAVLFGIPLQAIIGGITVLTNLNPWVVGLHFLASMVVIAAAYAFWRRTGEPDGPVRLVVPGPARALAWLITAVSAVVLVLGTFVTGSGPHAGDHGAARNGLDPETISQLHADSVFLLVGLSVGLWYALRAVGAPPAAVRAAGVLIVVELAQGLIGFVQALTGLPVLAVGAHMVGSCLVLLAVLHALYATRVRTPRHRDPDAGVAPDAGSAPAPAGETGQAGHPPVAVLG